MKRLALVLVFAAAALPATSEASAILVNGSFEVGPANGSGLADVDVLAGSAALVGWEVFAASASGGAVDHLNVAWDVSDGVHAIDLDGRGALFSGVRQTFVTTPGRRYDVAFDLSGNPGVPAGTGSPVLKRVQVSVDGLAKTYEHDSSGQARDSLVWDAIVFSFIASGPSATLQFMSLTGVANSYGALIDNVRVTVPEPATLLLLGAGVVTTMARRKRSLAK
jgi:choice-of-anchor C domain-containing protein